MKNLLLCNCPLCDAQSRPLFRKQEFWIHVCTNCGHYFSPPPDPKNHIDQLYGNDYFFGGGAGYEDYLSENHLLQKRGRQYARILARYVTSGKLLDVGCGAGFILRGFSDEGWQASGIEPNEQMATYGRSELGMNITNTSLEGYRQTSQFDVVSVIQVLAHFIDVRLAMRSVAGLLEEGGHCLIETWRRDSVAARLFGHSWHEYSPPTVLHWFTKKRLIELMDECGFTLMADGYLTKWLNAGHAASLISYKLNQSLAGRVVRPLLSMVPKQLSLPYVGDDLMWLLFQKR